MDIEVKIDKNYEKIKILILTPEINDEVDKIVKTLNNESINVIAGFKDDIITLLDEKEIINIYANNGKIYAVTNQGEYVLRLRLYELENRLDRRKFVRISNSEIINLNRVKSFDLNFIGTICVSFINGKTSYVSRRYVSKIKQKLGL